jgi:hypothetical protein
MFEQGSHLALLCYSRVLKARLQQIQAQYHADPSAKQLSALPLASSLIPKSSFFTKLHLRPSEFTYNIHGYPLGAAASLP